MSWTGWTKQELEDFQQWQEIETLKARIADRLKRFTKFCEELSKSDSLQF